MFQFDRTPMDIALSRMQMDIVQLLQAALSMVSCLLYVPVL